MQQTDTGMWILEIDEESSTFSSKLDIIPALTKAVESRSQGRADISVDEGKRSWMARFLGMSPRIIQMHLAVEWCHEGAALIFFDDAVSEHRAMDTDQPIRLDDATRRKISHGEPTPATEDECMSLPRALQAITEYVQTGQRPAWLRYRVVE